MAGKRFTVRSRSIRWREGRYKGRRGSSPRPPPKPRPVLDVVIAVGASLIAAFFVLCMAFSLLGAYTRKDRDGVARDIEQVFSYFPILKERMSQDAGLLSGGQQQMLAISRALIGFAYR